MDAAFPVLLVATATGAGLVGGLFFAFSSFIMSAFDRLPAVQAIAAMQSINIAVLNPIFFSAFFGTAAAAVAAAALAVVGASGPASMILVLIGAATYVAGSILVTILFNVPLNNRLAGVRGEDDDPDSAWRRYRVPWTRWNHVRTVASLAAAAAFVAAMGV